MDVTERLGHGHAVRIVQTGTAVGLGFGQPEQAQPAQITENLVGREHARLFPLIHLRVDLLVDVAPQGVLDLAMLVGVLHVKSPQGDVGS